MQNLFTTSDGEQLQSQASFSNGRPIVPDGTQLEAAVIEARWGDADAYSEKHIVIGLAVVQPGKFSGETFKHKLHVNDNDLKKADRGKKFLITYDSNIKRLLQQNVAKGVEITDSILASSLVGGKVIITMGLMKNDRGEDNNFIRAVGPSASKPRTPDGTGKTQVRTPPPVVDQVADDREDDIPFN